MPDVVAAATGLVESAPATFTGSVPERVCREVLLSTAHLDVFVPVDLPTNPAKPVRWADAGTITIRLDAQGRLVGLAVDVPSADGTTTRQVSQSYRDFGRGERPTGPPASEARKLPAFPN